MLTTRVIPCLAVKDGRVVIGVNLVDLVDSISVLDLVVLVFFHYCCDRDCDHCD